MTHASCMSTYIMHSEEGALSVPLSISIQYESGERSGLYALLY